MQDILTKEIIDFSDLAQVTELIQFVAPAFLGKPGCDNDKMEQVEKIKKIILIQLSQSKEVHSVDKLKSLILTIPKEKRQAMIWLLMMMGIWDGIESSIDEETLLEPMTPEDIVLLWEWIESQEASLALMEDAQITEQMQLEILHATSIATEMINIDQVYDVQGYVVYQDADTLVLRSEEYGFVGMKRVMVEDVGIFRGAYVHAQLSQENINEPAQIKLLKPGITLDR